MGSVSNSTLSSSSLLNDITLNNASFLNNSNFLNDSILNTSSPLNDTTHAPILLSKPFVPCDNPENVVDQATAKTVETIFHLAVLPAIELFGVTTNVLSIIVFVKQGLRDRINLCLFSLALADVSFLLLIFAAKFFTFLGLFDEELENFWSQKYFSTVLGPMMGTMNISNLMTMIISVERCICVVSPFTAKRFLKTRYMAIGISIMAVYILGFYSFLNLKYLTVRVEDPLTNTSRWVSRISTFYTSNKVLIDILYNHLMSLAIPCVSLAVVVIATSITVSRLNTTLAWRHGAANKAAAAAANNASASSKSEAAVTRMLTVVCLVYVVTMSVSVTQAFFRTFIQGYLPAGKYCNIFVINQTLAHVFETTNSSVNFIIYYSMGTKFKSCVREICGRRPDKTYLQSAESLATITQDM